VAGLRGIPAPLPGIDRRPPKPKTNVAASFSKMLVSQLTRTHADGKPVAGQQFDYAFDTIGNRTRTLSGGDTNGVNLRLANYYANSLNQITNRDVPGTNDVVGVSWVTNSVNVNGTPAHRKGEYFQGTVGANNTNSALWLTTIVTNLATGINVTGNVYVAQQPELFQYDADGNLISDGRWNYTWDAENRLVMMTVSNNTVGPQYQLTFAYDYQGRRIQKIVATNSGTAYVTQATHTFLYDGWNLVAELNPDNSRIRTYMWGSDLSGTMQGAGGVGGLLEVSYYGAGTTNYCFPAFDGNGNVAALINAADGSVVANYDYAAFGEPIRLTGSMARNNPFRFSTKYADDESDLLYYGYRYYKPSTGTWPNKDPMQEAGGVNLYCMVNNNPVNTIDMLGLWERDQHKNIIDTWLGQSPDINGKYNIDWHNYKWHCIKIDVEALLLEGNDDVDGTGGQPLEALCDAQKTADSYKHSMRAWYETVGSATQKRDRFVDNLKQYAEYYAQTARGAIADGNKSWAEICMKNAIIDLGQAQHPLADETSPAHAGFQVWYGPIEGMMLLPPQPIGWFDFLANHMRRETKAVYTSLGNGPANTVAGEMHPELLKILQE